MNNLQKLKLHFCKLLTPTSLQYSIKLQKDTGLDKIPAKMLRIRADINCTFLNLHF